MNAIWGVITTINITPRTNPQCCCTENFKSEVWALSLRSSGFFEGTDGIRIHATFSRDHEYRRHGALNLLAGIDLLSGKVLALVEGHRSREFIEFLKLLRRGLSGFDRDQN